MIDLWPWTIMGIGVISLFAIRYVSSRSDQRFLYLPQNFDDDALFMKVGGASGQSIESIVAGVSDPIANHDSAIDRAATKFGAEAHQGRSNAYASVSGHEWMPVAISLLVLLSALFVILSNSSYGDAQQKWAFGVVGTILGYWLKK